MAPADWDDVLVNPTTAANVSPLWARAGVGGLECVDAAGRILPLGDYARCLPS